MLKIRQIVAMMAVCCTLTACQSVKESWQNTQAGLETSSTQFKRFVASLHMQQYVPGMPDMPVYQGFQPQGNENAVYDVVEGRIIDITYASTLVDAQKVRDYYEITLAQLGWKATGTPHEYRRDDELLMLNVTSSGQKVILHILLQPDDK